MSTAIDRAVDSSTESGLLVTTEEDVRCNAIQYVYILIGCVGMLDNAFVLWVIASYPSMRHRLANFYIVNQSCIDLLGSCFVILVAIVEGCMQSSWVELGRLSGEMYCRLWKSQVLLWGCFMASTVNLVLITVERYSEIVHAIWHKSFMTPTKTYVVLSLSWIIGLGRSFIYGISTSGVHDGTCKTWIIFPNSAVATLNGVLDFLFAFAIPVIIMFYCYTRMAFTLRSKIHPSGLTNLSKAETDRVAKAARFRRNIFSTMATVSLCFVLCWMWNTSWFFLQKVGVQMPRSTAFYQFSLCAVYLNTLVNPVIYIVRYQHFKTAVKILLCKRRFQMEEVSLGTTTVH